MAPRTVYPDRRHLKLLIIVSIPLVLIFFGGTVLLTFGYAATNGEGALTVFQTFLLGATFLFGLGFLISSLSHWRRLRSASPAMSVEDRGVRLVDRSMLSLAKRPVFVPWTDIASLTFERGRRHRSLTARTHDGKTQRIAVSLLDITLDELAEECLTRAHKAGFIGTCETRDFVLAKYAEWRFTPA